jgi:DNA-binding transcriptional ArsR family regulator
MMEMSIKNVNLHKLFLKTLSNETRLLILESVRIRPKCVSEVSEDLGFEQSRISHGLKCLCNCGFVEMKRKGKRRIYSLNKKTIIPLFDTIDKHIATYGQRLATCKTLADIKARAKLPG